MLFFLRELPSLNVFHCFVLLNSSTGLDLPDEYAMFQKEVALSSILHHPNILKSYGAGTTKENGYFIVTELCPQGSLRDYLVKEKASITDSRKIDICIQISKGLDYFHSLRLVHRDIKR
jgi:serine/threonine protein kinase